MYSVKREHTVGLEQRGENSKNVPAQKPDVLTCEALASFKKNMKQTFLSLITLLVCPSSVHLHWALQSNKGRFWSCPICIWTSHRNSEKIRDIEDIEHVVIHLLDKYHELIYYIIRKGQPVAWLIGKHCRGMLKKRWLTVRKMV